MKLSGLGFEHLRIFGNYIFPECKSKRQKKKKKPKKRLGKAVKRSQTKTSRKACRHYSQVKIVKKCLYERKVMIERLREKGYCFLLGFYFFEFFIP